MRAFPVPLPGTPESHLCTTSAYENEGTEMCSHTPPCPAWDAPDHDAARLVAFHPDQGWCVNCTFLRSLGTAMSDCPRSSV
ncbi:DUF5999 family protein [Streptomyces sp.]|uniref:DUF5999 family protein n=1 Tax=Streptomyces sp. TaxID=1931 RepID=UPI0039C940A1